MITGNIGLQGAFQGSITNAMHNKYFKRKKKMRVINVVIENPASFRANLVVDGDIVATALGKTKNDAIAHLVGGNLAEFNLDAINGV